MTGDYYSINSAQLQPVSEVADLVDRASVTARNKQTDRRRAPIPSMALITGTVGGLHTAGVLMPSAVDGRPSGRRTRIDDWTSLYSVCARAKYTALVCV